MQPNNYRNTLDYNDAFCDIFVYRFFMKISHLVWPSLPA